jgi:hypothetical protein
VGGAGGDSAQVLPAAFDGRHRLPRRQGGHVRPLTGRVEKVEGGVAYLTYQGEIAATHRGTKDEGKEGKRCSSAAKLLGGVGVYNLKSGRLLSLTLVFDGRFRNYAPYDQPARFGAVVEWSREPAKR